MKAKARRRNVLKRKYEKYDKSNKKGDNKFNSKKLESKIKKGLLTIKKKQ